MVERDRMFEYNSDIRPWVRICEVLGSALDKMLPPAAPDQVESSPDTRKARIKIPLESAKGHWRKIAQERA
jgi:hypothetical protein